MDIGERFVRESRRYLRGEYLPKIASCLERLSEEDVWWRPNEASNAIGNLLLHLAGNVRQWIVSGVGGQSDTRDRQAEFDERRAIPAAELLERLSETVRDADEVLEAVRPGDLTEPRTIQGRTLTVFEAIYHVVEHFSMHTGQITYLAKLRADVSLGFYRDAGGLAVPTLPGHLPRD